MKDRPSRRRPARAATRSAPILALCLLLGACDGPGVGVACTGILVSGIQLTVVDAASGLPPDAPEVAAVAIDGDYAHGRVAPREAVAAGPIGLVEDRAGTYDVEVAAVGYETWRREDVRITADECHVRPVALEAALEPI
ncbi:MAG: carboxypeptidase-like regulatory domain-containing protein [Gemmatimonadetes bacterium]|nr:carboxypeptidase-like regulatory domain-containing protein [Gemmatimonadota bacterium]